MATIQAYVQFDPDRAPEQEAFLRSRVTVLRASGGQCWVRLDEAQVATLIDQGMQVAPFPDADWLQLGPVIWRPADETPEPPAALRAAPPSGADTAIWLLRFIAPADKAWLQDLALAGAEQLHQIDAATAVFRMSAAVADAARAMPVVASVGLFHPAYVPGLDLAGLEAPLDAAGLAGLQLALPPSVAEGNLALRVFDALDSQSVRPALEAAGAIVVDELAHGFLLQVAPEAAAAVLSVPGLLAASTPAPAALCNHNAGVILGANQVRDLGTVNFIINLDGLGEVGAVVDSGFDVGNLAGGTPPPTGVLTAFHPELAANIRLLANSTTPLVPAAVPDNAPHGTHVAGIVAGDGTSSAGLTRGMAPRAALVGLAPLPGNVRPPFDFAAGNGARVINNSWGSSFLVGVTSNRYTVGQSQPVDRWCFDNPEVLVLFAAGNDESDTAAGGDGVLDARTLKLEATAKNALTVGASENVRSDGGWRDSYRAFFGARYNNAGFNVSAGAAAGTFSFSDNANAIALFSDHGQVRTAGFANTRRVKPDLVAPGTNIMSTRSQWVAQPPALPGAPPIADPFYRNNSDSMLPPGLNRNLHQILTGTSMATPMVTGCALLVRQYYRSRHAQMRRPLLLEGVALAAAPPQPGFASRPAIARHPDGLVCAWITPALAADKKRIVAIRVGRHQAPADAAPRLLRDDVGEHAALQIATVDERSYLLHRHRDGKMRLSCYDRALAPVAAFGTAGVVTLAPDARPDDAAPPALLAVNDQLVCVWPTAVGNGGFFQRFRADTGAAVDAASVSLLFHDATGGQHPLAWDGSRYTFCGVVHGASWQLQLRQIDAAAQVQGAGPVTVLDQAAEVREPCLIFDPRGARYLLVWCDARNVAGGEIWLLTLDAQAAPVGAPRLAMTVPAGNRLRRPQLVPHPDTGYLLAWEDDTQGAQFDLYLTTLDLAGQVDGRVAPDPGSGGRRVLRLSDSPADVDGFALAFDAEGFVFVYQNPDEVNADRIGVDMLNLTRGIAFEAQADSATPLQDSGRYVVATLLDHDSAALTPVAAAWTGASWDLLRLAPGNMAANRQQWLRLNADGVPDPRHGVDGVRELPFPGLVLGVEMLWTGNDRRISAVNDAIGGISVHFADADGAPIATFGAGGAAALVDAVPLHERTTPQLGFFTQPAFNVVVAYASLQAGVLHLRMQRLDVRGRRVGNAVDLATCDGVAGHGWFMFVNGEGRSIAVYHRTSGADTLVLCRRFDPVGAPVGAETRLSSAAGEARNAVLARRPTAVNSTNREYGAAWQYRTNAAAHWQIRFSRLDRQGVPMANPPVAGVVQPVSDFVVIDAATPDWDPARDAVEPQLVSTFTHEPWTLPPPAAVSAPEWSPAWGLAWIGVEPDGTRRLYFTALDENGRRLALPQPPPNPKPALPAPGLAAPAPAPIVQLGSATARVQDFRLAWNGRVFLLTWTEEEAGRLRHRCTLVNRQASQQAYALPSAALLRATLVGGATNITPGPLPDTAAGYGWGRVNLRQSLAPALPVTFQVRDDCGLGPGRSVRYHFTLPPGTALLRVTLNWTDPPGPRLVNHLHLTVRAPAPPGPGVRAEFRGNLWNTAAGQTHLSRPVANPPAVADSHEDVQTFKQVVLANPAAGEYEVEVAAAAFPADPFNQQNLQAFALVFAGTGPETVFNLPAAAVAGAAVY